MILSAFKILCTMKMDLMEESVALVMGWAVFTDSRG